MCNGPVIFKVNTQELTVQSRMEAELVAAALAMKKAVYCAGMMGGVGMKKAFKLIPMPIHIDNTRALRVAEIKTCSSPAKHVSLKLYYVPVSMQEGIQ